MPSTRLPVAAPATTSPDPASAIAAKIRHLHQQLTTAESLRPGRHIDGLFRQLVSLAVTTQTDVAAMVLTDPAIQALRPDLVGLCARGEHELEVAWAGRVATSRVPQLTLARFPYLDNYRHLTHLEHATLTRHNRRPVRRALFVGSGPLPLSSLLHAQHLDIPIDNLDSDLTAVDTARTIARRLGSMHLTFHHTDLTSCHDLNAYDVVILAALVGLTESQKQRCLHHLHNAMAPGALLLARSAHGLKTLLYPAVDADRLHRDGWDLLAVTHPDGQVINSTILARKPPPL